MGTPWRDDRTLIKRPRLDSTTPPEDRLCARCRGPVLGDDVAPLCPACRTKARNAQHSLEEMGRGWRSAQRQASRCVKCGGPVDGYALFCAACRGPSPPLRG